MLLALLAATQIHHAVQQAFPLKAIAAVTGILHQRTVQARAIHLDSFPCSCQLFSAGGKPQSN
jgi:hypothetical protein